MKATLPPKAEPSSRSRAFAINCLTLAVSITVLFFLWTLNYNKLGSFYDYSILADAAGKFGAGLRPFRDFSSTLQSLPIWLARACELLFGPRYLALAYGNLLLTLAFFFVMLQFARKGFSFPVAILAAMAVVVASSLQHGIIWYNSIGLLLLSAISLKCADLLRVRAIGARDALMLSFLLLMIGMTKMNFNSVAIGMVIFFAVVGSFTYFRLENRKQIFALASLALASCAAPPFIETLANHAALSTWIREIIRTPASRAAGLTYLASPAFYLLEWNRYYPGTVLNGSVLFCLFVYGFLAYAAIEEFRREQHPDSRGLIVRLGILLVFWGSTCLLILTNVEIESLCLSFSLVGVIAMRISGEFSGEKWRKRLATSALILSVYFLLAGGISIARHSRISYRGDVFPGETVPGNGGPEYLRGVELSPQAMIRLDSVNALVNTHRNMPVYWGPGLEIMNRIYGGVSAPAFPLWYHLNVTVRDADAPSLIEAIEKSDALLVVADEDWIAEFPASVRDDLDRRWSREPRNGPLLVYRRKSSGRVSAGNTEASPAIKIAVSH